jgi:hypothetical protein
VEQMQYNVLIENEVTGSIAKKMLTGITPRILAALFIP